MIMNGIIEKIKAYPARGEAGRELSEAYLVENSGLKGDFYATGGERQISLLIAEIKELMDQQKEKGLCFSRFKENITIRGIEANVLQKGVRLYAGEAELEITGETKQCYQECPLFEAGKTCLLAGMSLFAKVKKSGVIRAGERISL